MRNKPNDLKSVFPEYPDWTPELTFLRFHDGNPDDYQYSTEVPVEDFPMYYHAPELLLRLRELVEAIQYTPLGTRQLMQVGLSRAAIKRAEGATS